MTNSSSSHKKLFLNILIAGLSLSALVGIVIFLIGEFSDLEFKILLTTLSIGAYSLCGFCCALLYPTPRFRRFSTLGMIIAALAFLLTFLTIWVIKDWDYIGKPMLIFLVLAFTFGHLSLFFLIQPKKEFIQRVFWLTVGFISIVSLMLIGCISIEFDVPDFYFRLLGVFAILDVLGTLVTPILNKMQTEDPPM